jgi:hypothetical protein
MAQSINILVELAPLHEMVDGQIALNDAEIL